jgi:hypothetical protein
MQKITVVGKDSPAKAAVINALNSNPEIIDLRPDQIYLNNINCANLIIYVSEEPDHCIVERLNSNSHLVILQSQHRARLNDIQKKVIHQLSKSSSEEEILNKLRISRRAYYTILAQLRTLYGVKKNRQLIQLVQMQSVELDQVS